MPNRLTTLTIVCRACGARVRMEIIGGPANPVPCCPLCRSVDVEVLPQTAKQRRT